MEAVSDQMVGVSIVVTALENSGQISQKSDY